MNVDQSIDTRGLACPLPLLHAKKALNALEVGQLLAVTASDPASEKDFHSFIALTKHELVEFTANNKASEFHYIIKKGN